MFGQACNRQRRQRKPSALPAARRRPAIAGPACFDGLLALEPRLFLSAAPVAVADVAATTPSTQVVIPILANDFDPDGGPIDPSFITVTSGAGYGTLDIDYDQGLLIYTPDAGFVGTESLAYVVSDADGNVSNEAAVTITVADAPPPPPVLVDVTFTLPASHCPTALVMKRDGNAVVITSKHTGQVLFTHALDTLNSLTIEPAAAKGPVHLAIDLTGGSFALPGGLRLIGGNSRCPDEVTIAATSAGDQVTVAGNTVTVNGLAIELALFEKLKVKTAAGVQSFKLADLPRKPLAACRPVMAFVIDAFKHLASRRI